MDQAITVWSTLAPIDVKASQLFAQPDMETEFRTFKLLIQRRRWFAHWLKPHSTLLKTNIELLPFLSTNPEQFDSQQLQHSRLKLRVMDMIQSSIYHLDRASFYLNKIYLVWRILKSKLVLVSQTYLDDLNWLTQLLQWSVISSSQTKYLP